MQKLFVDAALARSLAEALRRVVVALVDRVQGCDVRFVLLKFVLRACDAHSHSHACRVQETHAAMEAIIAAATELAMSGDARALFALPVQTHFCSVPECAHVVCAFAKCWTTCPKCSQAC